MATEMKRPGGRTERTRAAVLGAVYDVIIDCGYAGLSVEAVAERSGVHKTTIYRRWGTIEEVLLDAVLDRAEDAIPLERTGDTRADLVSMGLSVAENLGDPASRAVLAAVLGNPANVQLRSAVDRFWERRLSMAAEMIIEAQESGVVDRSCDPRQIVERVVGPIWFRIVVTGQSVDRTYVEMLVDSAL